MSPCEEPRARRYRWDTPQAIDGVTNETGSASNADVLPNYIGGQWVPSRGQERLEVRNPATGELLARTPLSTAADVDAAVAAAADGVPGLARDAGRQRARAICSSSRRCSRSTSKRLARIVTTEHGKTLDESRGSVRRGIECVEVACGAPSLMMGYGLENIAHNIDCHVVRQPIGVCARDHAVQFSGDGAACGSCHLPSRPATPSSLKPSEQVPLSQQRMFQLLEQCDLPPGVVNLVNGGKRGRQRRSAIIRASAPCRSSARRRSRATSTSAPRSAGKRVQALGGAKNFVVVMPDADFDRTIDIVTESFYGCAGERCLAGSVLVPVG